MKTNFQNHKHSIDNSKDMLFFKKQLETLMKEVYDLKKKVASKDEKINTLENKLEEMEKEKDSIYSLATRTFKMVKALAYSTGRFLSNSVFMEDPTEQLEYIKEFDLKDPEEYPIGTYKARNGRLRNIVEFIKEKGEVTTKDIVNKFRICHHTARADMRDLLDAFPNALRLILPKSKGRESYKLVETSKLSWGLPVKSF